MTLATVLENVTKRGLGLYTVRNLEDVREIESPEDWPVGTSGFLILLPEEVVPYTGYEDEPGGGYSTPHKYWSILFVENEETWQKLVLAHWTHQTESTTKKEIVALPVGAAAKAVVTLSMG